MEMRFSKGNDALGTKNRGNACESGLCTLCRADCKGKCETWLSSMVGRKLLYPRDFGHARDRFSRGMVDAVEAGQLRRRIVDGLMALRFEGDPVIRECRFREELYPGPLCDQAPDIVCVPHDGFELKGKFDRSELFGLYGRQGMHTAGDVFFYDSDESDCVRLRDVGKEVLRYFGVGRIV